MLFCDFCLIFKKVQKSKRGIIFKESYLREFKTSFNNSFCKKYQDPKFQDWCRSKKSELNSIFGKFLKIRKISKNRNFQYFWAKKSKLEAISIKIFSKKWLDGGVRMSHRAAELDLNSIFGEFLNYVSKLLNTLYMGMSRYCVIVLGGGRGSQMIAIDNVGEKGSDSDNVIKR
jgi:hypothetical protein